MLVDDFGGQLFPEFEGTFEVVETFPSIKLRLTDGVAGSLQERRELELNSGWGSPDKFAGDFVGLVESAILLSFWMQGHGDDEPGVNFAKSGVIPDALHEFAHESGKMNLFAVFVGVHHFPRFAAAAIGAHREIEG